MNQAGCYNKRLNKKLQEKIVKLSFIKYSFAISILNYIIISTPYALNIILNEFKNIIVLIIQCVAVSIYFLLIVLIGSYMRNKITKYKKNKKANYKDAEVVFKINKAETELDFLQYSIKYHKAIVLLWGCITYFIPSVIDGVMIENIGFSARIMGGFSNFLAMVISFGTFWYWGSYWNIGPASFGSPGDGKQNK